MIAPLSAQNLLALANQAGAMATAFASNPTAHTLEPLRGLLEEYATSGLRSRAAPELLRRKDGHSLYLHKKEIVSDLLGLEGEALGHLMSDDRTPADETRRLQLLIEDRTQSPQDIAAGIREASRHLHQSFLSGFLWTIDAVSTRGQRYLKPTHLKPYPLLESRWRQPCFFKPEGEQEGGSYAIRGVVNLLLHHLWNEGQPLRNHTLVIAPRPSLSEGFIRGAKLLGFNDVEVHLPANTHKTTITNIRTLGARPKVHRVSADEIETVARQETEKNRRTLFLPSSHSLLAMGYGTIGVEIAASLTAATSVIVPSADTMLLSGLAAYFEERGTSVFHLDPSVTDTGTEPLGKDSRRREAVVVLLPDKRAEARDIARKILLRT